MLIDFDKLRHLSQFSIPLLLAALVVIFFHNGNASFNLQLDADQRMQQQHEKLADIQAIFLDYLIELQNRETVQDASIPLSIFPEFAPLPLQDQTPRLPTSDNVSSRQKLRDRLNLHDRFGSRKH